MFASNTNNVSLTNCGRLTLTLFYLTSIHVYNCFLIAWFTIVDKLYAIIKNREGVIGLVSTLL